MHPVPGPVPLRDEDGGSSSPDEAMNRWPTLRAVVETVVPHAVDLDEQGWREVEAIIERAVSERPIRQQRQISLFIGLIQYLPVLRRGARFSRLGSSHRMRFLLALQDSPFLLLRRGLWGLRTLAFMGYYGRPEAASRIGYAASPAGWEARVKAE
jgi:hypothetical protein